MKRQLNDLLDDLGDLDRDGEYLCDSCNCVFSGMYYKSKIESILTDSDISEEYVDESDFEEIKDDLESNTICSTCVLYYLEDLIAKEGIDSDDLIEEDEDN